MTSSWLKRILFALLSTARVCSTLTPPSRMIKLPDSTPVSKSKKSQSSHLQNIRLRNPFWFQLKLDRIQGEIAWNAARFNWCNILSARHFAWRCLINCETEARHRFTGLLVMDCVRMHLLQEAGDEEIKKSSWWSNCAISHARRHACKWIRFKRKIYSQSVAINSELMLWLGLLIARSLIAL